MSPRARFLLVLLLLGAAAVCVRLALWQRDRLVARRARNDAIRGASAAPVIALPGPHGPLAWRRVRTRGTYDRAHEIIIRGQVNREAPGVLLVTPLRPAGSDTALLVLRGFVPAANAVDVNLERTGAPGEREVAGVAAPIEPGGGEPIVRHGVTSWRRLDLTALRARLPYPVYDVVVYPEPADTALTARPRGVALPALDDGPHLNYTFQWSAFAVLALGGAVLVALGKVGGGARGPDVTAPRGA